MGGALGGGSVDGEQGGQGRACLEPLRPGPQGSAPLQARGSAHLSGLSAQLQLVTALYPSLSCHVITSSQHTG